MTGTADVSFMKYYIRFTWLAQSPAILPSIKSLQSPATYPTMKVSRDWATPVTIGSFGLMAITGLLMFFHLDSGLNKTAHEWLAGLWWPAWRRMPSPTGWPSSAIS